MLATVCLAALIALALSAVIGIRADWLGRALGVMDWPDLAGGRKQHRRPTPLVGGGATCAAIVFGAILSAVAFVSDDMPGGSADLAWFGATVSAMYFIGLADDRHTLSPRTRLGCSIVMLLLILSAAPMFTLTEIRFSSGPAIQLGAWSMLFTLICLVGLLNAVNMADGKNGVVISMALIWTVVLSLHAPPQVLPVLAAAAVSLLTIFWFNMRGRLFLGDGGSYGLSAAFGLLAIYVHKVDPFGLSADRVALMFAFPVLDTIRLMSTRALRGTSPFMGDRDHFHHHLERRWGWPKGLLVYAGLGIVTNGAAQLFPSLSLSILVGTVGLYFAVLFFAHVPEQVSAMPDNVTALPIGAIRRSFTVVDGGMDEDAA